MPIAHGFIYILHTPCIHTLHSYAQTYHTKPIMHSEYKLQFNYIKYRHGVTQAHIPSEVYCDTVTHTAMLDLYIKHNITCTQPNSTTLVFESSADRMLAQLALSDAKEYTVMCA